ncbi:MAG TPA: alkaline shock response membrane anchor protein AmaP [Pseudonocardia sp.]|jgi:hypothetical protein|uniref:alkaline shock response membrane anchor protein AmaP n=1 Tax=Pseudonocardia sp. TaxID=60912 RepID=UPI002F401D3B
MSRRSRRAAARSTRAERSLVALLGLLLLVGGALGLLVGRGVLGEPRSYRPLLDPLAVQLLRTYQLPALMVAVLVALLLVVLGLLWLVRSLRPERRPDLVLEATGNTSLRVTAGATAEAVARDAERLPGVERAAVRLVGRPSAPALRLTLWLTDGADVRTIWRDLEESVLARVRSSLGVESMPTAIRLELDRTAGRTRVS